MSIVRLSISNLISRPLGTSLSLLLLTLSVALISLLLQMEVHIKDKLTKNIKGIDMVLGAKGSPLQVILSAVYHLDDPTGNISYDEANRLLKNQWVDFGIPLSYGDNYRGYRIVGTTLQYPEHYEATISRGRLWEAPFEVTVGAVAAENLNLKIGNAFTGAHGLDADGDTHDEHVYRVVGILDYNHTVLDQLILTATKSIWMTHHHEEGSHDHEPHENQSQITAMLVGFKNPTGLIQLPRMVNKYTSMQAAVPAYEISRLFSMMGLSINVLHSIGIVIMIVSGLSIGISLYSNLKDRKYEMALMRTYGASRVQLMQLVILEGIILTLVGFILGCVFSRLGLFILSTLMNFNYHYSLSRWTWVEGEWILLAITAALGLCSSLLPAIQAFYLNISKTLADA